MRTLMHQLKLTALAALALLPQTLRAGESSGTLIQLNRDAAQLTAEDWAVDFEQMKAIGIDTAIIQWSAEEGISYFTNALAFVEVYPAIEGILEAATQKGIDVYLGLHHDSRYWDHVTGRARVLKDYFYVRVAQNEKLQLEMLKRFGTHDAFKGYYIPDEIDDINWRVSEKTPLMKNYLAKMSERLRANDKTREILVSAFYRMRTAPDVFASNLKELVGGSHVSSVLVQDGLGDGISWKYAERYVPIYYTMLAEAFRDSGVNLWIVIETFTRNSQPREPFAAGSADAARVQKQINLARPHASKLIYFTFPNYMDPDLDADAAELHGALSAAPEKKAPGTEPEKVPAKP
ncbi:MAG: DUF4434 domain-containing protein [Verrucomicrobia bacterium]|nr:DUF4434 domain-containing protein [Verrucomicrobiota bacterium]